MTTGGLESSLRAKKAHHHEPRPRLDNRPASESNPLVFIFRSCRPLRATRVQHTAHVPPVNNSYAVGLQRRVKTAGCFNSRATGRQEAHRAHRRTADAPQNYEAAKRTARRQPASHICEVRSSFFFYYAVCMRWQYLGGIY